MEHKIGEIFEYNGKWYQCIVKGFNCTGCDVKDCPNIRIGVCSSHLRNDGRQVKFKKLKKVGKSYADYCRPSGRVIYFQRYKCYQKPIYVGNLVYRVDDTTINLEIKQNNKEDNMEEKKIQLRQEDIDWLKSEIRWSVLPGYSITLEEDYDKIVEEMMKLFTSSNTKHSNSEKIGKNLKPFDLEKAKAGKPICTRDGRKARIICFDRRDTDNHCIVALIEDKELPNKEWVRSYFDNGKYLSGDEESIHDLMMLPEKKEGWVNIYRTQIYTTLEKAEKAYRIAGDDNYLETIKVEWEE